MIHGIYVKNSRKSKWHLVSVANSPEAANMDVDEVKKQIQLTGNDQAEIAIQMFDSSFYVPEILSEIKEQKLMYN